MLALLLYLVKWRRETHISQLPLLPDGSLSGALGEYLHSVNMLRECWHKAQSLFLLNEQVFFFPSCEGNRSVTFEFGHVSSFLSS